MRLYQILALQRLGLSLAEIARVLESDGTPLTGIIDHQLGSLKQEIAQATALRKQLEYVRHRLKTGGQPNLPEWLGILCSP